jgi:predicted CoA-binding protein
MIDAAIQRIIRTSRTIAVVGLSPSHHRPSHEVASYLQGAGYRIVPVRPDATSILGETVWPDLVSAAAHVGPIDIVDVFRRSEYVADLAEALLAIRPKLVWLQLGVKDEATAKRLEAAGIAVVMDHCLMVEHHSLARVG